MKQTLFALVLLFSLGEVFGSQSELIDKMIRYREQQGLSLSEKEKAFYGIVIQDIYGEERAARSNLAFISGCQFGELFEDECNDETNLTACVCCKWLRRLDAYVGFISRSTGLLGASPKRSRQDVPPMMPGQHAWLLEIDNTSFDGGGPFDIQAELAFEFDDGLEVTRVLVGEDAISPKIRKQNSASFELGRIRAGQIVLVVAEIDIRATGSLTLVAELDQDRFDPDTSNNRLERTLDVGQENRRLLFPWVSMNDQFLSLLVINNPTPDDAFLQLQAVPAGEDDVTLVQHYLDAIPPYGSVILQSNLIFADEDASHLARSFAVSVRSNALIEGSQATISLESASQLSLAQGNAIRLPLEPGQLANRQEAVYGYLPLIDDFTSAPVVINTGPSTTDVTMSYYSQGGELLLTDTTTLGSLESQEPFATVTNSLVDADEDVYLVASSSDQPITGLSFVFNAAREPAIGNVTGLEPVDELVLPWVSSNQQFESILIVNNIGDESVNVDLTARRALGDAVRVSRTIPGHGYLKAFAGDIFSALGDGPGFSVVVEANRPQILGRWVTNNLTTVSGRSPAQGVGVALPGTGISEPQYAETLLFSWTPNRPEIVGAIVITNLGTATTDVTLSMFANDGSLAGTLTLPGLAPHRPSATLASTLFPADVQMGYVVARSAAGEPLAGVTFLFNSGAEPAIGDAIPLPEYRAP